MSRSLLAPVVLSLAFAGALVAGAVAQPDRPETRRAPVTDVYFGTPVVDDYRWLEQLDSPEVQSWLRAQSERTAAALGRIPGRDSLLGDYVRLDALKPADFTNVSRKGGRYFYEKTTPADQVARLCVRNGPVGRERILFDPAAAGQSTAIDFFVASEDGSKVALGLSEAGSESDTIRVLDVGSGAFLPESIFPCWEGFGGWTPDGTGFTYNRMSSADVHDPRRELGTRAFLHQLGTDPGADRELLSSAHDPQLGLQPEDSPEVRFSADSRYVFGYAETVRSELTVYAAPATTWMRARVEWRPLLSPADSVTAFVTAGDTLYALSHRNAPAGRILATSVVHPDLARADIIYSPPPGKSLRDLVRTRDNLLLTVSDGIDDRLIRVPLAAPGKPREISLASQGAIACTTFDLRTNDAEAEVSSWNEPIRRYAVDVAANRARLDPLNAVVRYPGTHNIVVEEVAATSADGTAVPLSILRNRRVARDGHASCLLSGYGAYGLPARPRFNELILAALNRGVIVAIAHVRGGGEYGAGWHAGGYKTTKPNTWKDFIACAEYLERNGYATPATLCAEGTSAGGILVGRAITERPDLFAAAVCNVGLVNALRAELSPNGPANIPEFGTVKDSVECRALIEMDALSHVRDGVRYPAVLCVGAMNDPRTIVWQPAKFAAALQNSTRSGKPVYLQVNFDSGHFSEDKLVNFRNYANQWAFALWQTGHPDFQPREGGNKATAESH